MAGLGVTVDFEANIGKIEAEIKKINSSFNRFESDARRTSASVSRSFSAMEASAKSIRNVALSFAGGFGFAAITKDVLDTNRSMEALRAQLKAIEGSSRGAEKTFQFISDFAVNTPFEIQGLTDTYIKLQNFGIKPTQEVMEALTNQAAKLGGSQETLSGITLALGQAYAKGKLQAEEMNQLIERGVPIYKILAEVTGQSGEALQEMAKNGELSSNVIDKVIEKMGVLASGSNAAAMDTLNGKISNLVDSWTRFQDVLLNDKSEGVIKSFVGSVSDLLGILTRNLDNTIEAQLDQAKARVKSFESLGEAGKFVADFTGYDINVEKNRIDSLEKQKALQKQIDDSSKAIAQTWDWVDEAENKTAKIADNLDSAGKKAKTIAFNPDQLQKSERIISRLRAELNLTREQAAGVVGNLFQESGLNTQAVSRDGFNSIGIAQWTDRGKSFRKTALEGYARGIGKLPSDLDAQIGFIIQELNTTEDTALSRLKNTSNVQDAAIAFRQSYERPDPAQANDPKRIAAANTAFLGGFTESEIQKSLATQENALKQQQDWAVRVSAVYDNLATDIRNSQLPEVQRRIVEFQSSILQQLGVNYDSLSGKQKAQVDELLEMGKAYVFLEEKQKLQETQAEANQANVEKLTAAYAGFGDVVDGLVTSDVFAEQLALWDDLLNKNLISADEFKKRMDAISVEFNKTSTAIESSSNEMSAFAEQAARNMQDSFANFLFDPFKDGVGGMVDGFATALRQMAAQAAAQQIFNSIFPKTGSGGIDFGGGLSGVLQGISGAGDGIGSFFGDLFSNIAAFDTGTPSVPKDGLAFIHKNEKIIPASYAQKGVDPWSSGGGGVNIVQHINVGSGADRAMVKQAAGQGAREALAMLNTSQRYR